MLTWAYDTRGPGIDARDIACVDVRHRCAWCEQGITELSLAITENLHVTLQQFVATIFGFSFFCIFQ